MRELEAEGWTFTKNKYFKGRCPCGVHTKMVHLTPSSPTYLRNLRRFIKRLDCSKGEVDDS